MSWGNEDVKFNLVLHLVLRKFARISFSRLHAIPSSISVFGFVSCFMTCFRNILTSESDTKPNVSFNFLDSLWYFSSFSDTSSFYSYVTWDQDLSTKKNWKTKVNLRNDESRVSRLTREPRLRMQLSFMMNNHAVLQSLNLLFNCLFLNCRWSIRETKFTLCFPTGIVTTSKLFKSTSQGESNQKQLEFCCVYLWEPEFKTWKHPFLSEKLSQHLMSWHRNVYNKEYNNI